MLTVVLAVTLVVVMVKFALVTPAATVALAGTTAELELLLNETNVPPLGAALVSVTVPWTLFPPVTLVGFNVSEVRLAGGGGAVTVRVVVRLTPL